MYNLLFTADRLNNRLRMCANTVATWAEACRSETKHCSFGWKWICLYLSDMSHRQR